MICQTIREQFESLDFIALTAVVDSHHSKEDKNEDTSVRLPNGVEATAACDVCKVSGIIEKAVAYCVDCEVKACDVHITEVLSRLQETLKQTFQ